MTPILPADLGNPDTCLSNPENDFTHMKKKSFHE